MASDTTTGIPNPDKSGHWTVPPWPAGADFGAVVRHFARFRPWDHTNTAQMLAFYAGYQAALEGAPAGEPRGAAARRWREDMRACVDRCAQLYRDKHAAETRRTGNDLVPALRPAA